MWISFLDVNLPGTYQCLAHARCSINICWPNEWTTVRGQLELTQLKMTLTPPARLTWTFQSYPCFWSLSYTSKYPPHCTHSHFTFGLHFSVKTSSTLVHPYVGHCMARTSIHFQYPWLLCPNSFHVHPWALACLSPLSICLGINMPACGWLDCWHGIESPNNARGLHGQAALHSRRHLSCGEGLLSESQGVAGPLTTWLYLKKCECPNQKKVKISKGKLKIVTSIYLTNITDSQFWAGQWWVSARDPWSVKPRKSNVLSVACISSSKSTEKGWECLIDQESFWENSIHTPRKQCQKFSVHCVAVGNRGEKGTATERE